MHHNVPEYAELAVKTNFSFLRGASHGEELVARALDLGLQALGVADINTLAGVVRAHVAAKAAGLKYLPGARVVPRDGPDVILYPEDRAAYGRLTKLLTIGQRRADKGDCDLGWADIAGYAEGQWAIVMPPAGFDVDVFAAVLDRAREIFGARARLGVAYLYRGDDRRRLRGLADLARRHGVPLVAVNEVEAHTAARKPLQDVMTAIREGVRVADAGTRLHANAERHLKGPAEMARLFAEFPDAIAQTLAVAEACTFSLDELRYNYPNEPVPHGRSPQDYLAEVTGRGLKVRYPGGVPDEVAGIAAHELELIGELGYAPYFLTVHDIVSFARAQGILCQGRGSAANSVVCYALGITSVNPVEVDLLFERFVSAERGEPPDIDVDFEHERREEVIQYIYARYGRHRAALAATVVHYRHRRAVREVGKVMGLSEDAVAALAGTVWGRERGGLGEVEIRQAGLNPRDPHLQEVIRLTEELVGFPRHLSQHVGGFVLTETPLDEVVPIQNAAMQDRTVVEWDKDDLDALGILKIDVLALGMLTCLRKGFALLRDHYGVEMTLARLPREDPAVYDMLCRADSVGVFQVESRAQMNMLPRLKPRTYYDLVIEVAIVRPGPIQGDMVHPYLRRRNGTEAVAYPSPAPEHGPPDELKRVLHKTLGVPLFQEQAMRIAIVAAGFTPAEADRLRRAMATFRRVGTINSFREKLVRGMTARGYDRDFAGRCFKQIEGFGEYGFPESHAASFALLVYASAWLKRHYADVFAAALLNAQPMGFYAPAQIVRDAREHGVTVAPPDVNKSAWDNILERAVEGGDSGPWTLRLGFRQVDGFRVADAETLIARRGQGYGTVEELRRCAGLGVKAIERLAAADAFRSVGLDRRQALWEARALSRDIPLPLFVHAEAREEGAEPQVLLPEMPLSEHVVADYQTIKMSLKAHPMSFLRGWCRDHKILDSGEIARARDGARAVYAGVILVRQRPGTAKGVVFITLEDELGIVNAIVWPKVMERFRKEVMASRLLAIRGHVQSADGVIHLIAEELIDLSHLLLTLWDQRRVDHSGAEQPDTMPLSSSGYHPRRHPRDMRVIPKSRDFH